MNHLSPDRVHALVNGTLDRESAAAVADHLKRGCFVCFAVLDELPEEEGVDLDLLERLLEAEAATPSRPGTREREAIWLGLAHRMPGEPVSARIVAARTSMLPHEELDDDVSQPDAHVLVPFARRSLDPDLDAPPVPPVVEAEDMAAEATEELHRGERPTWDDTVTAEPPVPQARRDRVPEPVPFRRAPPRRVEVVRPWRRFAPAGAALLAAALMLVFIVPRPEPRAPEAAVEYDGQKGTPTEVPAEERPVLGTPVPDAGDTGLPPDMRPEPRGPDAVVDLSVLTGSFENERFELRGRAVDGRTTSRGDVFLFDLETKEQGARALFAFDGNGRFIPLLPPAGRMPGTEKAGRRPVTWRTQWVTLDPADLTGPLTIVAGWSEKPMPVETDMVEAWRRFEAGEPTGPIRVDFHSIHVELGP